MRDDNVNITITIKGKQYSLETPLSNLPIPVVTSERFLAACRLVIDVLSAEQEKIGNFEKSEISDRLGDFIKDKSYLIEEIHDAN